MAGGVLGVRAVVLLVLPRVRARCIWCVCLGGEAGREGGSWIMAGSGVAVSAAVMLSIVLVAGRDRSN